MDNVSNEHGQKAIISAERLSMTIAYGAENLTILNDINLSIFPGESVAIVGSSGSGKTTLLGLLAGMDVPSQGKVWLADEELTALDEDGRARVRARKVGFVFQSFQLLPSLSALENVMLPLELKQSANAREKALELLDKTGLSHRINHRPMQLSGGEQQRVAIARAFACEPRVLFADEPTGNLDTHTGEMIIDLLFALNKEQKATLVLVTHDIELAARCDRYIELSAGEIVPEAQRHHAQQVASRKTILQAEPLPATGD